MENTLPQAISPSELAPVNGTGATPFSQQTVVLTKQAYIELTWQANYWRAPHPRLFGREKAPKGAGGKLPPPNRDLNQRLYGAKSEEAAGCDAPGQSPPLTPPNLGRKPRSA